MRRWPAFLLLVLSMAFFLAGCWSRYEIENLALVMAMALDAAPEDKVCLSVSIIIPRTVAGGPSMGGGGGGQPSKTGEIVCAVDTDFAQAARRLEALVPRRILWAQNQAIIIREELASRGLESLDYFTRGRQMRPTTPVLMARGEARKMLETSPGIELNPGNILGGILRNRTSFKVELKDLMAMWQCPGDNPVLPQVVRVPTPKEKSQEVKAKEGKGKKALLPRKRWR